MAINIFVTSLLSYGWHRFMPVPKTFFHFLLPVFTKILYNSSTQVVTARGVRVEQSFATVVIGL